MGSKPLSAGKGALLLTVLGTLSQLLGFGYRVALSRLAGAEVMGLYQLIMPVYSVLLSVTAVGLTAAMSNLTSQYLALGNRKAVRQVRSTCLRLFFLLLLPVGIVVIWASDAISVHILGDARTQLGLILLVPCVALTGVENIHKHCFYGSELVGPPAVVELLEQFIRTAAVLGLLILFLPQYPERVVGLIVAGMVICEVFSALTLLLLYRRHTHRTGLSGSGESGVIRRRRIAAIALPVAANALLGNVMGAANSTLIPQKLVEGGIARSEAIAQLGVVCGMTMPMLALPTVFLGPLNLVLVPKLARASALNRPAEVRRLVGRAISVVSVVTLPTMAWMVVWGADLGQLLFRQNAIGAHLLPLALTMALSCFCSVLGSALNGVNKQRAVAAVSLLGSAVQLSFTLVLVPLPEIGMLGYVAGALVSTLVEAILLLWLVGRTIQLRLDLFSWLVAPGLAALLSALVSNLLFSYLTTAAIPLLPACICSFLFALVLYLAALYAQGIRLHEVLNLRRAAKKRP